MQEELDSLKENNVWDVVPAPAHRKVVTCKWVYKIKTDAAGNLERYKARLVARGFSQIPGQDFDEVFSPVVRYDSMRLLLAISASRGWKPRQLDIKTAFLYGILKEEVYMQLPEGSRQTGMVARLKRCLYGLKQASREWYHRLVEYLAPHGLAPSAFDPCVLIHTSGDFFIAIYVDDLTLYGPDNDFMDQTVRLLECEFKVNDMGTVHWLLGIRIDIDNIGIRLSQTAYIDTILTRFGMQDCNPVSTPLDVNHRLRKAEDSDEKADASRYQQIVGSINYLVTATRPDLAYTITHLSQFNSNPTREHFNCLKRVLRFLKGSRTTGLFYPYRFEPSLAGFSDASYGNFLDDRTSFSGYIFQFGPCTISWRSRKQSATASSTAEAEYMALAMCAKQQLWLQRGLYELVKRATPSATFADNQAAIDIAHNPRINDRTKHIDIAFHFTRHYVETGELAVLHVPSKDNLADICTKSLPRTTYDHLCAYIFGTS
jgi:hypothetical protein